MAMNDPGPPIPEGGKSCSKCGAHYADVPENFYTHGRRWTSQCKACVCAHKRKKYHEDPDKHRRVARESYHRHAEERRAKMRARNRDPEFKKYRAEYNRQYREENEERMKALDRQYYWDNREERLRKSKQWREENAEHLRQYEQSERPERSEEQLVRHREYQSEWAKNNRDKKNAAKHRRRARENQAEGDHTAEDVATQKRRQSSRCYWCHTKLKDTYHVDHIIPLSRGGSNGPANIVIACPPCNFSKNNKLPSEFAGVLDLWA